jgi:hypothetical protein
VSAQHLAPQVHFERLAARSLDQRHKLGFRARHDRDDVSGRRQCLGEGPAQPAAAAGDDCDLQDALPCRTFAASVVAIQMPAKTATRPIARLNVIGSPTSWHRSRRSAETARDDAMPTPSHSPNLASCRAQVRCAIFAIVVVVVATTWQVLMMREHGFAARLREWRQRRGWSQLDLAY